MLDNTLPNREELSCPMGHTCSRCLLYRSMPVDVTDPTTGKVIKQGTVWDCVWAWNMLGSWDAGRQAEGVHAAVNQMANTTDKRQQQLLSLVANGTPPPQIENSGSGS